MNQFLPKLVLYSRRCHRFLVLFATITFVVMAKTGLIIKYRWFITETTHGAVIQFGNLVIQETYIRKLHSDYSVYFTIIIGLMMITGIILYIGPKIITRQYQKTQIK